MRDLILIIKKELTELLRDQKTLINSIVLPALILPLIMFGATKVMEGIHQKNQEKSIQLGLVNAPEAFMKLVKNDTLNKVINYTESIDFKTLIDDKTIQSAIVFPSTFTTKVDSLEKTSVLIYRNGSKENVNSRVSKILATYSTTLTENRMTQLNISSEKLTPFNENYVEVGEQKELIGKTFGGYIPYFFIMFMWSGCMLAAIDLVTGEKERKTIETTLSLPVSKFKVLMGKTIVASLLGLIPAALNIAGLIIGLKFIEIPEQYKLAISEMLNFQSISLILLLLVPLSIFLSAMVILLVAGASTFKEAQSKATPFIIALLLPLIIALMPGIEFTWSTVFIPIFNIALGIKEIMAGTIDMAKYSVMLVSLIAFAVAGIYFSYKKFSDENAILS